MAVASLPFSVAAVHFAFPGNTGAIRLRDPESGTLFGTTPEWTWAGSRQPAAFPGGSRPVMRVTFRRSPKVPDPSGRWRICGHGHRGPSLADRTVNLQFNTDGLSQPVEFRLDGTLPDGAGSIRRHWHWSAHAGDRHHRLGVTRHLIYHTWRRPLKVMSWSVQSERDGIDAKAWVYLPLMKWSCSWAAGGSNPKAICDALLANLNRSKLQYGVAAWNVGGMLQAGGGYCGGWYRMFQALAAAQGVRVERRSYLVNWREEGEGVARWCAIVVSDPGLNRHRPLEVSSTFHDSNIGPGHNQPVQRFDVRRYRFWGHPGQLADGHCINFLRHCGRWYLYDASFRTQPVALSGFRLPSPNPKRTIAVEHQGNFQGAYLNQAVGHLLGTLRHAGKLYRTERPLPTAPTSSARRGFTYNGLSVKTAIIPARWRNITFYWMG
jgi:hypothetical protein